jgi:hypothetical protein
MQSTRNRSILFFGICLIISCNLSGQKILPDTFYVPFRYDTLIEIQHICIREVVDKRDESPNFVRYDKKTRYLLIPVDQEVYTLKPLAEELAHGIPCDTSGRQLHIEINKFSIEKQKGRMSSNLYLQADLAVYEYVGDSLAYQGTFYYDYFYISHRKRENLEESTTNLLHDWHTEYKLGLMGMRSSNTDPDNRHFSNFIADKSVRSLYVNTTVASFVGINWWGLQAEVYFARPETNKSNRYISGIVRYQNLKDYESLAIGRNSEHTIIRQNAGWTFDIDYNFLIGLCKWKDPEAYDPTLYQLFDFELSSIQSLEYNPINRKALTFRVGVIESLDYMINRTILLQAGLIVGLGIKL